MGQRCTNNRIIVKVGQHLQQGMLSGCPRDESQPCWTGMMVKRPGEAALVAHACNPSYSAGRDQEDHSSKPAQANSLQDPNLKKKKKNHTHIQKGGWNG
jgi:hypothetical protein